MGGESGLQALAVWRICSINTQHPSPAHQHILAKILAASWYHQEANLCATIQELRVCIQAVPPWQGNSPWCVLCNSCFSCAVWSFPSLQHFLFPVKLQVPESFAVLGPSSSLPTSDSCACVWGRRGEWEHSFGRHLTCMATLMVLYPSCISWNGGHIGCHPFFTKADMPKRQREGEFFYFREHGLLLCRQWETQPNTVMSY